MVAQVVKLDMPRRDGSSLREHFEALREAGFEHPLLQQGQIPMGAEAVWSIFWSLNSGRQNHGFGPVRFSWADLRAWSELFGHRFELWELRIIKAMDDTFVTTASKELDDGGRS